MPVVVVHQGPTVTKEAYDQAVNLVTGGTGRLESPSDWPVEGLILHTAGEGATGFRIVDVWESREAFSRFGEVLMPMLSDVGITDSPEVYEPSTFVSR